MTPTFLKPICSGQLLALILVISSGATRAGRFENDTISKIPISNIKTDSIPKPVFEPLVINGKDAAAGAVMFSGLAMGLNIISIIGSSMGPALFAYVSSIIALVFAGIAARLSRKRKGKIPFNSLTEYKAVRKKAGTGAILGALAFVIAIICASAFLTFTNLL